jgi:hypothetical protein
MVFVYIFTYYDACISDVVVASIQVCKLLLRLMRTCIDPMSPATPDPMEFASKSIKYIHQGQHRRHSLDPTLVEKSTTPTPIFYTTGGCSYHASVV